MKRALLGSLLVILFFGSVEASEGVIVESIRYLPAEDYIRVEISLNGPVIFTQNRISNPDRIYFDLDNSLLSSKVEPSLSVNNGALVTIRAAQFNKETVRVVLVVRGMQSYKAVFEEAQNKVVIDVYGKQELKPVLDTKAAVQEITAVKRIVIDPGHGGHDPGAIGPNGLQEKDVVLEIAKKLGKILKENYNMEVVFTRDRDVFIPLGRRTSIANNKKADLFVSIHANASRRRGARGIETYFLNSTDDDEAIRVAARENAISLKKMREVQQTEVQKMLMDLASGIKQEESLKLAGNVQVSLIDSLKGAYEDVYDLGVKWALFYVLVDAKMPAILIETSFISNNKEEKLLSRDEYRAKIAEAIADGIRGYIAPSKLAKSAGGGI
ncbi:MAG: N-acetylmuramoyl-L-alanine amidase [Nitrospirae bacterium]|nr:N-acetylmuramoyl-L-alanine amidase [Nitrospirota bacterium]